MLGGKPAEGRKGGEEEEEERGEGEDLFPFDLLF